MNTFPYLGLLVHYSSKSFSEHIRRRVAAAHASIACEIRDLRKLSVSTAVALFNLKIIPMLSYSLDRVWGHLSESCFKTLEGCFCTYMRNRFVYIMANCIPAVEPIRNGLKALPSESFTQFVLGLQVKVSIPQGTRP